MVSTHILGYPRIGARRELKKALEAYWARSISVHELSVVGNKIREDSWQKQSESGLDYISVGDFSWYDHVLDTAAMLGVVPNRFKILKQDLIDLNTIFLMARGDAPDKPKTIPLGMTKWFNTNYHYIVPELSENQQFTLANQKLFVEINHALELGYNGLGKPKIKPVILGPISFLWLAKAAIDQSFNKLDLIDNILPVYIEILHKIASFGIKWVQIDEPALGLDLPSEWLTAFGKVYTNLKSCPIKILLATYFAKLDKSLDLACKLPVSGLHIDAAHNSWDYIVQAFNKLNTSKILSIGIINGRNIWKADINNIIYNITHNINDLSRVWIASSCSLMHCPLDLDDEPTISPKIKQLLAFANQKLNEINAISQALTGNDEQISELIDDSSFGKPHINTQVESITKEMLARKSIYSIRAQKQQSSLLLPLFPTTTIGSFPQTKELRRYRLELKQGKITKQKYYELIKLYIKQIINTQNDLGLDVLVHGEPERCDLVEYFAQNLDGFETTQNGWVQSYGSRCVKPPIIYGDIERTNSITIDWLKYASSLTNKPVKAILTGPITLLARSFVREDQSLENTAKQIALALRQEIKDLEKAGIKIIQVDEPAFCELMPLNKNYQLQYLNWAKDAFKLATCVVDDSTQIHTHMCYSEFGNIIEHILGLDVDVITLECARSKMESLQNLGKASCLTTTGQIGLGVFDVHSSRVPTTNEMVGLLQKCLEFLPNKQLWVNPDCGLKTRTIKEVEQALANMVQAAKIMRYKNRRDTKTSQSQEFFHNIDAEALL